ncbi:MAG: ABC transporter substrate-binding protein [Rhodocyclaceae bacterium]|jgi:ABC-type branched-subunit amino acid transport system substrate-binding protein|nr:ABC transporter substrate-binding protein [Rhodocyclaceae bacterium]
MFLLASASQAAILVAHIAPMSGPVAAVDGQSYNLGIRVAIEALNAHGGVLGNKIKLKTLDDQYKPDRTVELIRAEADKDTVALLLPVGSAALAKVLKEKVLEDVKIPVVGLIPGSEPLRSPINPYLYHVRAGDMDQYRRIVEHIMTVGMKRVAVVYADIPFGKSGMAAVESLLKGRGAQPATGVPFALGAKIDFKVPLGTLRQAAPDVVILVSPPEPAGLFVKEYRDAGLPAPIMTLSYGSSDTICAVAGKDKAYGVAISQVVPNAGSPTIPLSRRFNEDFKHFAPAGTVPTQLHYEGYITTQVLAEALKRAGTPVTREKLIKSLDGLKDVDLGGFIVSFSPTRHTGSSYVDIGIISRGCRLVF